MEKTIEQYNSIKDICYDIFIKKLQDYGLSWRILRSTSITDQIYIKARRIRSIEEKGVHKINEGIKDEYIGIVNYCIMGLIQLEYLNINKSSNEICELYKEKFDLAKKLMINKNHDYDEVWREMRSSSYTDLILMKILRIKQIEDNQGKTIISEDISANYLDMLNYSIFALIKIHYEE